MKFVSQLLSAHVGRYPRMQLDDVYKLLHQAALGPGHAVDDPAAARKRLHAEAAALQPASETAERDVISPDGRLARIHLGPYLARGGDLDRLCDAFVATADRYPASPEKLAKFCGCLGELAATGALPFSQARVVEWFERIAAAGYPAVHHSQPYAQAYRPAYRVVAIDLLDKT